MLTRLEKTLYRLEAQHACLNWAVAEIEGRDGLVFELGLGLGRTFNHLKHNLGSRQIYVFEREVHCYPDCRPEDDELIIGNLEDTLPDAVNRFAGQVVLAHCDVGSMDRDHNRKMSGLLSRNLGPALCDNAIVLSDLPLDIEGTSPRPLPGSARVDRYYLYRKD